MLNARPNDLYIHVSCTMQDLGCFPSMVQACYMYITFMHVMCMLACTLVMHMSLACCIHVYNMHSTISNMLAACIVQVHVHSIAIAVSNVSIK